MSHFKKGVDVYLKEFGDQINYNIKYRIRSCGKKTAIVDRVNENSDLVGWRRGQTFYIGTEEEGQRWRDRGYTSVFPTKWSDHFVLINTPEWDSTEN